MLTVTVDGARWPGVYQLELTRDAEGRTHGCRIVHDEPLSNVNRHRVHSLVSGTRRFLVKDGVQVIASGAAKAKAYSFKEVADGRWECWVEFVVL